MRKGCVFAGETRKGYNLTETTVAFQLRGGNDGFVKGALEGKVQKGGLEFTNNKLLLDISEIRNSGTSPTVKFCLI